EYKLVKNVYKQLTEKLGGRKKRCYHKLFHGIVSCESDMCQKTRKGHTRINIDAKENYFIQIKEIKAIDETQITENHKIDETQITGDLTEENYNVQEYKSTFEEIINEKFKNPVGITHIFDRYYNLVDNELNVPGTKIIAKHLSENNVKVYANVLEM
ncbi:18426_t:CDS:1, partial [Racocetra persica]